MDRLKVVDYPAPLLGADGRRESGDGKLGTVYAYCMC